MDTYKKTLKTISETLIKNGFEKHKNLFYKNGKEILYVIGAQKSQYSDILYINLGYFIKEIHFNLIYPKYAEGDIQIRFTTENDKDFINTELSSLAISDFLIKNISKYVDNTEKNGLYWLLDSEPTLVYLLTQKARKYLNL